MASSGRRCPRASPRRRRCSRRWVRWGSTWTGSPRSSKDDGVDAFAASFDNLLAALAAKIDAVSPREAARSAAPSR